MLIKANSNIKIEKDLFKDNTSSIFKGLQNDIYKKDITNFSLHLQTYITKLGLILSECVEDIAPMKYHTCHCSLTYICKRILHSDATYKIMLNALNINEDGNTVKHTIKDVNYEMNIVIREYNAMIKSLIETTKLSAFKRCYLRTEPKKLLNLDSDTAFHKYFKLKNEINMELKLCPNYYIDKYSKTLHSKITLFWLNGKENCYVSICVTNAKNNKVLAKKDNINISYDESKYYLPLICFTEDLENSWLNAKVHILITTRKPYVYQTGALWWKEYHHGSHNEKFCQYDSDIKVRYDKTNQISEKEFKHKDTISKH